MYKPDSISSRPNIYIYLYIHTVTVVRKVIFGVVVIASARKESFPHYDRVLLQARKKEKIFPQSEIECARIDSTDCKTDTNINVFVEILRLC